MKIAKAFVLILAMNLFLIIPAYALPTLYTVVLDASGSVSEPDFHRENLAAATLLKAIYAASQVAGNKGLPADFISVAWFGGNDDYEQIPYFNASHLTRVAVLSELLEGVRHPNFGHTAIYSALLKATYATVQQQKTLGGRYNHVIVLVTDGQDTQSPLEVKRVIRELYPNDLIYLAILGVGPEARINEFSFADDRRHISNFSELAAIFTLYSGLFR